MNGKYLVRLSQSERQELEGLVRKGKAAAYKIKHANILLKVDADGPAWTDERVADAYSVHRNTVRNVRQRFVEIGMAGAVGRKKPAVPPRAEKLLVEKEKKLLELANSKAPDGRKRWTLHLLAEKLVALKVVDSVCHETVRKALKKTT